MPDEMSVRQWQEQFRAGAFGGKDFTTQCGAGFSTAIRLNAADKVSKRKEAER